MDMTTRPCREFLAQLASAAPTPGGGGAAALMGAAGAALGEMVTNLTIGKKKYAPVEEEMLALRQELAALRERLLSLVEEDEKAFAPLAAAYSIPREQPDRDEILEKATLEACRPPMEMMQTLCRAIECTAVLAEKGSRLAVSDAGCAASFCKAALESASLNVFINTKTLRNRETAEELNRKAETMLETYCPMAEQVFRLVRDNFR